MNRQQLPPEIKSAEEHIRECDATPFQSEAITAQKERDLTIWNAAIEKAAATAIAHETTANPVEMMSTRDMINKAILNLKRKE